MWMFCFLLQLMTQTMIKQVSPVFSLGLTLLFLDGDLGQLRLMLHDKR